MSATYRAGRKKAPGLRSTELVALVAAGLPFVELATLRTDLDLPIERLAAQIGIPRATLHRRQKAGTLSSDESDRILRFRRLLDQAVAIFGSVEAAREWLKAPQYGLGDSTPLDYARTEVGAREVERLLGRIDYGVLA